MLSFFGMFLCISTISLYFRSIFVVSLEQLGVVATIAPYVGKHIKLLNRALSKHVCFFVDYPGDIPRHNILIESCCSIKHMLNICHFGHIPSCNILFARGRMKKHLVHVHHS
jgi:hypothetical protein